MSFLFFKDFFEISIVFQVVLLGANALNKIWVTSSGFFSTERAAQHVHSLHAIAMVTHAARVVQVKDVRTSQIGRTDS